MPDNGIIYCDLCFAVLKPREGTSIAIPINGKICQRAFHNRTADDCLRQKIDELEQQFAAPTQ